MNISRLALLFTAPLLFSLPINTTSAQESDKEEFILQLQEDFYTSTHKRMQRRIFRKVAKKRNIQKIRRWIKRVEQKRLGQRLLKRTLKRTIALAGFRLERDDLPLPLTYVVSNKRNTTLNPDNVRESEVSVLESNKTLKFTIKNPEENPLAFARTGQSGCSELVDCANDPLDNWGIGPIVGIDAYKAWNRATGSDDVVVAVLSTGIELTHSDLTGNLWTDPSSNFAAGESAHGFNPFGSSAPVDTFGLGTHEAGIIGAQGDNGIGMTGVNWNVGLMSVKVFNLINGNTFQTSLDAMLRSLGYIIKKKQEGNNIRVVHSSWLINGNSTMLQQMITQLNSLGILFVTSGGDNGLNINSLQLSPATYDLPNVLTSGSYFGSFNGFSTFVEYSPFSNRGDQKVHVTGPGESILSTWINNGYQVWAGSGVAAAFSSGTAALLFSIDDSLTPGEVKDLIVNNAKSFTEFSGLTITGGAVNAGNAVEALLPPTLAGDYNCDGEVNSADYAVWRNNFGGTPTGSCNADGNNDGIIDAADYTVWRDNFGSTL